MISERVWLQHQQKNSQKQYIHKSYNILITAELMSSIHLNEDLFQICSLKQGLRSLEK